MPGGARNASSSSQQQQSQQQRYTPSMAQVNAHYRRKNATVAYYTLSIILGTVAFSYGSVPLYKMICQTTGWGGQPVRAHGPDSTYDDADLAARLVPLTSSPRIRVTFNASVSDVLPWKFTPQQPRGRRAPPRDGPSPFYHGDEQLGPRHHRRPHVQRHARPRWRPT
ncbi:cytochrome c oxidase assembly protein COX11 [Verticillium alfalfae VaMs.102]|uniref:Cytochrome c oxidase assembly protein COX11 n=1 Tax=Verticillium alfalfae (strain VaMs.102 / ATCC MYA-4576 / FGSC 10136) TaxID=526221 RepID=C9SAL8_VERA1|nr:cytochrome c oxidase assembly protein COX11 [Verticillium alfalfae VaMs.102]EEY15466.1 cytochrome c oxidase assembly protein COX11 [Verticillium alfalfae VaMs.102]